MLWLATAIVHHANRVRENSSGVKVGGHQASSASMVSLMTALWFSELRAEDRVSVKPHASPVLHAINYLLGRLEQLLPRVAARVRRPSELPEPHEGPDPVDYSTGSVGHRRDGPDLGSDRAPLPRASPLRGAAARAPDRAARRRRARRGRGLGGDRRPVGGAARRGAVGGGPEPPVARPGRAGHRLRPPRRDVRGGGLAGAHREVRAPARGLFERAGRRGPAAAHRRDAERGVPAPPARRPGRAARAPAGAERRTRCARRRPRTTSCARPSATSAATTSAS